MNFGAVNPLYLAIPTKSGGGSSVAIFRTDSPGRFTSVPEFTGHTGPVMNLAWNPFNDNVLATVSADCFGKIWVVPQGGLQQSQGEDAQTLRGHSRKVGTVNWHPAALNVIATSGADQLVKVWDVNNGENILNVEGHTGLITSCEWNYDGSLLATACKDKHLRIIDPRAQEIVYDNDLKNHQGTKGNRLVWAGRHNMIISFGFGNGQRQYALYDPRDASKPWLAPVRLDASSGSLMGYYDTDIEVLFLAGKGDGSVNYYEFDNTFADAKKTVFHLSAFTSNEPQRGIAFMPKRGLNTNDNEIARAYKIEDTQAAPLHFMVPRRSEGFASDIYPPTASDEPALDAQSWFGGANAEPLTIDLADGYQASEKGGEFEKEEVDPEEPTDMKGYRQAYREMKARIAELEAQLNQ
jgi:hypothetical protein